LIRFFDQSRLLRSRSIDQGSRAVVRQKALCIALHLALHRTIGSVSVQSIEALSAVLIVQLVHRRIPGAV
jgi:hypothetical protein